MKINQWPDSQVCVGCLRAIFVMQESSTYGCEKNNDASSTKCNLDRVEATQEQWEAKF